MAEETDTGSDSGGKKLSLKTLLILGAIFVIEGAVIAGFFSSPASQRTYKLTVRQRTTQRWLRRSLRNWWLPKNFPIPNADEPISMMQRSLSWFERKYQPEVQGKLACMAAQISGDVRTIISRAEPNHLLEPTLATLKRQIKVALDDRLGRDDEGQSRIERVVITKFTQFRADL